MQPPCQTARKSPSNYRAKRPQQNPCQLEFFHIEIESQHVALCYTSPSSCMGVERHTHAACLTRPLKGLAYPAYQACPYHPFLSLSSRLPMSTSPSYITATIATSNIVCIPIPLSCLASVTSPSISVVEVTRNDADRPTSSRPARWADPGAWGAFALVCCERLASSVDDDGDDHDDQKPVHVVLPSALLCTGIVYQHPTTVNPTSAMSVPVHPEYRG